MKTTTEQNKRLVLEALNTLFNKRDYAAAEKLYFVTVHGRYSNVGRPVNWIAADIFRVKDGILAEHWDVLQDEAGQEDSMFGRFWPDPLRGDAREPPACGGQLSSRECEHEPKELP